MFKVAILGTENSHAWHFAGALKGINGGKLFEDIDLIGVYGDPSAEDAQKGNAEILKVSACHQFAAHYNDFLDKVDAVLVTARHGKNHLKYAKSYIEKGIPVWIDKPITASTEDALTLARLIKTYRTPVCGGSSLSYAQEIQKLAQYVKENKSSVLGGHFTAPISMENEYGGFWFYSQHLAQMIIEVFGTDIKSVSAQKQDKGVHAVYRYDGFCVTAFYGTGYTAAVYQGGYDAVSYTIILGNNYFLPELHAFYQMLKTGKGVSSLKDFIAPVYLIEATITAFEENREVDICIPEI